VEKKTILGVERILLGVIIWGEKIWVNNTGGVGSREGTNLEKKKGIINMGGGNDDNEKRFPQADS